MSDRKRALEGNGESSVAKKLKSEPTTSNGSSASTALSANDIIAQKRAEIAAKVAAMRGGALGTSLPSKPSPSPAPIPVKPASPFSSSASPVPKNGSASASPAPANMDDLARKVAEAKRRVAEAQTKLAVKDNPYMSMPQTGKSKNRPVEPAQQGAGLKMTAHPLLLESSGPAAPQSKKDRYKPMQPKFASIKANIRNVPTPPPAPTPVPIIETKANPYTSSPVPSSSTPGFEGAPKERTSRSFRFNLKGKYEALGNEMRREAQLEALKQRIAESARKAGMGEDFEGVEKNIRREPPPQTEWWDAALLPNKTYDDLTLGMSALNIRSQDSPVTLYIQHPIPIPAPGEKNKVGLKPLMLTKKEQKKMRKQRRQAELQDKRDRIRMGLIPPDAPKVRLSNLMKVLTSDAVQDPTRVEARVRREVAMRKHTHEKMNAERKLTDDQRREKIEGKKLEEEKKGIWGAVFKVKTLSDPAHRFKVRKNAEQLNLTGICIFNPSFSMVYVEGAVKFIRNYKRLMLHRMAWTEAARPRGGEDVELQDAEDAEGEASSVKPVSEVGEADAASLENNACYLVWEGQLRDRAFSNFKPKSCPTDGAAKEALGSKLSGYWDQAKNWKPEEEELF
ncbi:pre-mRNA processing factor 3-domain-containing protein [Hygrophoropsis aurantiaca]|uniref:Pre-mRNA processing factor 3-domain-containing protein n=1 Tax=Hygrophoropsis aurantiaca TaxID=72124 RepID=A0ACB8AEA2_9AGAM|nr:pre-mRNA processing factor 3-domain-containing protein [Hygrophoropsis aurantiaca]